MNLQIILSFTLLLLLLFVWGKGGSVFLSAGFSLFVLFS